MLVYLVTQVLGFRMDTDCERKEFQCICQFFKTWWKGEHILTKQEKAFDQPICYS